MHFAFFHIFQLLVQPLPLTVAALLLVIAGVYSLPNKRSIVLKQDALQFIRRSSGDKSSEETGGHYEENEPEPDDKPTPPAPPTERPVHPCFNTTVNKTVTTPQGQKILCLVPTEDDLIKIIKESGGFNKHYVAVTAEEAEEDFENPFAKPQSLPRWMNVTGRRRRSIDDNEYKGDGQAKRGVSTGLRSCISSGQRSPSTGLVKLCEECWWVTLLPDDKFPRYLNERICGRDGTSSSPPTGYCPSYTGGQCIQRSLTQDLLVRTNRYERILSPDPQYSTAFKQVWEPYGQAIRSCCECQNF